MADTAFSNEKDRVTVRICGYPGIGSIFIFGNVAAVLFFGAIDQQEVSYALRQVFPRVYVLYSAPTIAK
jgi:hypothetical protein